jgi:ubiquinone/menaquinone biosynthesis C-methylase UbiE
MNLVHRWLCNSALWRTAVEDRILPWTLAGLDLGTQVLEIGPGPGVTTEVIRRRVTRLTCMEVDCKYAAALARRVSGKNVTVVCGDGAAMPLADTRFDAVVCFTMLHHVPSIALQDRLLAEAARVLRPSGIFAGVDSLSSSFFRLLHIFDTMVTIDPGTFSNRLQAVGFENIWIDIGPRAFRFRARKPA